MIHYKRPANKKDKATSTSADLAGAESKQKRDSGQKIEDFCLCDLERENSHPNFASKSSPRAYSSGIGSINYLFGTFFQ